MPVTLRTTQALAWMRLNAPAGSWDEHDAVRFLQVFDRRSQGWEKDFDMGGPDREEIAQQTLFQFGQNWAEWNWPIDAPRLLPSEAEPSLCWHDVGVSGDAQPTCDQCGSPMVDGVPGLSVSWARSLWMEALERAGLGVHFRDPDPPPRTEDQIRADEWYYETTMAEVHEEQQREQREWERILMEAEDAATAPFLAEAERLADPIAQEQLAKSVDYEAGGEGWDEASAG